MKPVGSLENARWRYIFYELYTLFGQRSPRKLWLLVRLEPTKRFCFSSLSVFTKAPTREVFRFLRSLSSEEGCPVPQTREIR